MNDFIFSDGIIVKYSGKEKNIELPQGIHGIGKKAFEGSEVTKVVVPSGVTSVEFAAFRDCTKLRSIVLPDTLSKVGANAFENCVSLERIVIPHGVTNIGESAFERCTNLKNIQLPDGLTVINTWTFYKCENLFEITIPQSVKRIAWNAFEEAGLHKLIAPTSLVDIGEGAFANTPLERNSGEFFCVNSALLGYRGSSLNVTVPEGITHICAGAFGHFSTPMDQLSLPESVVSIHPKAFYRKNTFALSLSLKKSIKAADMLGLEEMRITPAAYAQAVLYQKKAGWSGLLAKTAQTDWNSIAQAILTILQEPHNGLSKKLQAAGDFLTDHEADIDHQLYSDILQLIGGVSEIKVSETKKEKKIDKPEPYVYDADHTLTRVYDSMQTISVPVQEKMAFDALTYSKAQCIRLTRDNPSITLEWLQNATISERTKQIKYSMDLLLDRYQKDDKKMCMPHPLSADLRRKSVITGTFSQDNIEETVQLLAAALDITLLKVISRVEGKHDMSAVMQFLQPYICKLLPGISSEVPVTEQTFCQLYVAEESEELIYTLSSVFFNGNNIAFGLHFAESREQVPELQLLYLLYCLLKEESCYSCVEMQLLRLVDQKELAAALFAFYASNMGKTNRRDIAPLAYLIARMSCAEQMTRLLTDVAERNRKSEKTAIGQAILRGAALNENTDALLVMDKKGFLDLAADVRHMTTEGLRAELIAQSDDLLDSNGQATLDYGTAQFTLTLLPNMHFSYYNNEKHTYVKSLPKEGKAYDQEKMKEALGHYAEITQTVKILSAVQINQIKEMLYSGAAIPLSEWRGKFWSNTVVRTLSQSILWGVYGPNDTLCTPFCLDSNGTFMNVTGEPIHIANDDAIGVVDAAQLSSDEQRAWCTVFWGKGTTAVVRQFEAPGRYVTKDLAIKRYERLAVPVGYAINVFGIKRNEIMQLTCNYLNVTLYARRDSDQMDVKKISFGRNIPVYEQMTDHQKRLWNRDIIRLDSLLHPQRQAEEIVCNGDVEQIKPLVDMYLITADNISDMLGFAIQNNRTEAIAYLMQLKQDWLGDVLDPFSQFELD